MGMAASQARLLTITARLADNELRSQTINNAKMRLSTQSSQASENYINALNNATMKFSNYDVNGEAVSQNLTFNALTAYSSYNTQYGLANASGQLLVSESEAAMFKNAGGNLNKYLQAHGLEYTTTYFENIGAMKNDAYPTPFNNISVEDLKSYYEQYSSFESSLELQNFQESYKDFVKETANLNKAVNTALKSYLVNGTDSLDLVVKNDDIQFNVPDEAPIKFGINQADIESFKNAFKGTNSNNYNIVKLKNEGLISETDYKSLEAKINNIKYTERTMHTADGDDVDVNGIQRADAIDLSAAEDTKSGTITYTIDGDVKIVVDKATGKVKSCEYTTGGQTVSESDTNSRTLGYAGEEKSIDDAIKKENGVSFKDFVNNLYYTETVDSETSNSFFSLTGDGTEKSPYQAFEGGIVNSTDTSKVKEFYNDLADDIINSIMNSVNKEKFAQILIDKAGKSKELEAMGIDLKAYIPGLENVTLAQQLTNYQTAKDTFLDTIFDSESKNQVVEDLQSNKVISYIDENGETKQVTVTPENLTDIDFILQYLKQSNLTQSNSFNTIIKQHIVETMIENNGTPKYAWVDSNDTSNKDNADTKAQWYTNLFKRMQQGYKAIENGLASSSQWMEYALESGIVTLEQVDKSYNWNSLDYKSCTKITEETDDAAVTKAEAEYNRAMNDIEAKDNIYDIELKNIDTEHTSLQTEYDVIKGVISKNIDRTFKFNQSA
mgnify:FL=1